jgi:hypothetical protein
MVPDNILFFPKVPKSKVLSDKMPGPPQKKDILELYF